VAIDFASTGFVLDSQWYWDLFEGGASFADAPAAHVTRDFLAPLARLARDRFAIDQIEPDRDEVRFVVASHPVVIRFGAATSERVLIDRFVCSLNAGFVAAKVGHAFALVVPRRYELRGVLIADDERGAVANDPSIRMPSDRTAWCTRPRA
jgi:hypothetical protein